MFVLPLFVTTTAKTFITKTKTLPHSFECVTFKICILPGAWPSAAATARCSSLRSNDECNNAVPITR